MVPTLEKNAFYKCLSCLSVASPKEKPLKTNAFYIAYLQFVGEIYRKCPSRKPVKNYSKPDI